MLSVIRRVRPRTSSSPSFLCFVAALQPFQNSPYSDPDISILRCNEGDDASCAPCRSSTESRSTLLALIARYFTNCVSLENIDSLIICVMIAFVHGPSMLEFSCFRFFGRRSRVRRYRPGDFYARVRNSEVRKLHRMRIIRKNV